MKVITNNEKETGLLGSALGRKCRGGEVFALSGDLGAGKTKLLQGLAKGLRVRGKVNSPTFNILKIYRIFNSARLVAKGPKVFCHIDAYRLNSAKDLLDLGLDDFIGQPEVVTAIEWAEKVKGIWPAKTTVIKIRHLTENKREINIR